MKRFLSIVLLLILSIFLFLPSSKVDAQQANTYFIYFGGIGCPHCAKVNPKLIERIEQGNVVMIEYETYKNLGNSQSLLEYVESYNLNLGIPLVLFSSEQSESGDKPILDNLDRMLSNSPRDTVFLADGNSLSFDELNLNDLKRYPTFYSKDRVAIKRSLTKLNENQNNQIKTFISANTIEEAIANLEGKKTKSVKVEYSGGSLKFDNAMEINGWLLQWNGASKEEKKEDIVNTDSIEQRYGVSIGKTVMLGLADSVNPCAISVLALMLISIVTYNPRDRKQVLYSGLAFTLAVVIMYLFYGYLIITAFQVIQSIASIKLYIYKALGIGAILLGLLELKDYFKYKPGGVTTEMPLFLRPKVQKVISKITSPFGAFSLGLFVTVFLLPCTIGPYIILGGLVADQGFINAIPMLLLYNIIFVLPMVIVVILVFVGSKRAEEVKDWKDKNVRKMHLIAGILMLLIGILMTLGIF